MAKVTDNERILEAAREKQRLNYKGNSIRLSARFLYRLEECQDILQVLKGKNLQPKILYPARISFKIEGEIKTFSNKQKEYRNTKPILKEILKRFL